MKFLDQYSEYSYAAFRIVAGFLFLFHGTEKLFNFPQEFVYPLNALTISAAVIELVASFSIMFGFFSRITAFIASGTMAVAYWLIHGLQSPFPMVNGGELPALYCFAFLMFAAKGPGIWSINKL